MQTCFRVRHNPQADTFHIRTVASRQALISQYCNTNDSATCRCNPTSPQHTSPHFCHVLAHIQQRIVQMSPRHILSCSCAHSAENCANVPTTADLVLTNSFVHTRPPLCLSISLLAQHRSSRAELEHPQDLLLPYVCSVCLSLSEKRRTTHSTS